MCPPLSCCHARGTTWLSTQLNLLIRLLLAGGHPHELASTRPQEVNARLDSLWERLHEAIQYSYRVGRAHAQDQAESLLSAILHEECCCQAVRRTVSLAEALGLVVVPARAACRGFLGVRYRLKQRVAAEARGGNR